MKLKSIKLIALCTALVLTGCANQEVLKIGAWSETASAKAELGEILWSDYYKQVFEKYSSAGSIPDKSEYMRLMNIMITASEGYESNQISKNEFQNLQRILKQQEQRLAEQQNGKNRAAWAAAFSSMGQSSADNAAYYRQQANKPQNTYTPPVVCDSRALSGGIQTTCK